MQKGDAFFMSIGEKIKLARQEKGYTQLELSKKLGISRSTVACYESERRTPVFKDIQHLFIYNVFMSVKSVKSIPSFSHKNSSSEVLRILRLPSFNAGSKPALIKE